jgi:hypothetical protein
MNARFALARFVLAQFAPVRFAPVPFAPVLMSAVATATRAAAESLVAVVSEVSAAELFSSQSCNSNNAVCRIATTRDLAGGVDGGHCLRRDAFR